MLGAVKLNGTDTSIITTNVAPPTSDGTVVGRFVMNTDLNDFSPPFQVAFGSSTGGHVGHEWSTDSTGTDLRLYDEGGGTIGPVTLVAGTWYELAATFSGTNAKFWLQQVGSRKLTLIGSSTTFTQFTPTSMAWGREEGSTGIGFAGAYSNWKWYSGVSLSEAEILRELRAPVPVRRANLWGWWRFNHAQDYDDYSGAGHHGTLGAGTIAGQAGPPGYGSLAPWMARMVPWNVTAAAASTSNVVLSASARVNQNTLLRM